MSAPTVIVHPNADLLARAVAARLVTRLVDAQAATGPASTGPASTGQAVTGEAATGPAVTGQAVTGPAPTGQASIVLTGGGILEATLAAVAQEPARDAVDWRMLDVWWGDERFLRTGHPDRNETPARALLLDQVDVAAERVHPMPASDGPNGDDPEAAATRYAAELAAAAQAHRHRSVPPFDVVLLGMGPDGHVASLFPSTPALDDDRPVVAVRGAPKPPPTRLSLTLAAIRAAKEVWVVVAGERKAQAVQLALTGADARQTPAAGVRGRHRTLWLLDRAAASQLSTGRSDEA